MVIIHKSAWFIVDSICNLNNMSLEINSGCDWVGSIRSLFQFENLKYNAGFALLDLGNYIAHAVVIIESFISNKFTEKNNQLQ